VSEGTARRSSRFLVDPPCSAYPDKPPLPDLGARDLAARWDPPRPPRSAIPGSDGPSTIDRCAVASTVFCRNRPLKTVRILCTAIVTRPWLSWLSGTACGLPRSATFARVDFSGAVLHVRRVKNGTAITHPRSNTELAPNRFKDFWRD
jgi:hypothetical protein